MITNNEKIIDAINYLEKNKDEICYILNKEFKHSELMSKPLEELICSLRIKRGAKIYRYMAANDDNLELIENGIIRLSDPKHFDDAFDSTLDVSQETFIKSRLHLYLETLELNSKNEYSFRDYSQILISFLNSFDSLDDFKVHLEAKELNEVISLKLQFIYLNLRLNKCDEIKAIFESLNEEYDKFMQTPSEYRILSFSAINNSLKMWSQYANNNKGICVEYEVDNDEDLIFPVIYSHFRGNEKIILDNFELKTDDSFYRLLFEVILRKDIVWQEQLEIRLVTGANVYKNDCKKSFKISSIFLGFSIDENTSEKIINLCKNKGIKCYKMVKNERYFRLDSKQIL